MVTGASCLTVKIAEGVSGVALTCSIARQVSSIDVPADARTGGKRCSAICSTFVPLLFFLGGGGVVVAGGYAVVVGVGGNVITVRGDGSIIGTSGHVVYWWHHAVDVTSAWCRFVVVGPPDSDAEDTKHDGQSYQRGDPKNFYPLVPECLNERPLVSGQRIQFVFPEVGDDDCICRRSLFDACLLVVVAMGSLNVRRRRDRSDQSGY